LFVVIGFVLRLNPLIVIFAAGLASALAAGLDVVAVIAAFGKAFVGEHWLATYALLALTA
jgi:uncharacterized membrane protein